MKQNQAIKRYNDCNQNLKCYMEFLVYVTSKQWNLGFGNYLK